MLKQKYLFIFIILFSIWTYILNGIPYFAYKSELKISKPDNSVTLTLYPTKRNLSICKLDEIKSIENSFNTLSLITPKFGSKRASDNRCNKFAIIIDSKKINIYPMMKSYDIEDKIILFKHFISSNQDFCSIQFNNNDNLFVFIIILLITSVLLYPEIKNKQK